MLHFKPKYVLEILALCALVLTPAAAGTVTFSDSTFDLSDYTGSPAYSSDGISTITLTRCASCGESSAPALVFMMSLPNNVITEEIVAWDW